MAHLIYGVRDGNGFVLLTGEVGTGKTTLCRCLLRQLPEGVETALIFNPKLTAPELLEGICDELGIAYKAGDSSRICVDLLNQRLLKNHSAGRRTVLIVDEAQNLSAEVLEQIRLLTNLETDRQKLLQILLIGQPELQHMLAHHELRQLSQRITARHHLLPLSLEDTSLYIAYRLAVAGCKKKLFTKAARQVIWRYSDGVPRLINIICDRALLGGFAQNRQVITRNLAAVAARQVLGLQPWYRRWRRFVPVIGLLFLVLLFSQWYSGRLPSALNPISLRPDRTVPGVDHIKPVFTRWSGAVADKSGITTAASVPEHWIKSRSTGFSSLLRSWHRDADKHSLQDVCSDLVERQLRCFQGRSSLLTLRRLDRPTLLFLQSEKGQGYAILQQVQQQQVVLQLRDRIVRLTDAQLRRYWTGEYLLIWQLPEMMQDQLIPGSRSQAVLWLRRALNLVQVCQQAQSATALSNSNFDSALQDQVAAFQECTVLQENGLVGPQTIMMLTRLLGISPAPRLTVKGVT